MILDFRLIYRNKKNKILQSKILLMTLEIFDIRDEMLDLLIGKENR